MFDAHDTFGHLVQATCATRAQSPFFCPDCRRGVILRKGGIRAAYFAHRQREARQDCPRYNQQASDQQGTLHPSSHELDWFETSPPTARLLLEISQDRWCLGVLVPPLSDDVTDHDLLYALERARIIAKSENGPQWTQIPGVELWPGSDSPVIRVGPHPSTYHIRLQGADIPQGLFSLECDVEGLTGGKAFFISRDGRWRRLAPQGDFARWGDELVLIHQHALPPETLKALDARQLAPLEGYQAYHMILPPLPDPGLEKRLEGLGCRIAAPQWRLAPRFPVPFEVGDEAHPETQVISDGLWAGIWAQPHSPRSQHPIPMSDKRLLSPAHGGPFIAKFLLPKAPPPFMHAGPPLRYRCIARPDLESLAVGLGSQERLRLIVGERVISPLAPPPDQALSEIEFSPEEFGDPLAASPPDSWHLDSPVPVRLRLAEGRLPPGLALSRKALEPSVALRYLQDCAAHWRAAGAMSLVIEIDAGGHGHIRVRFAPRKAPQDRHSNGPLWLTAVPRLQPDAKTLQFALRSSSSLALHAVLAGYPGNRLSQAHKRRPSPTKPISSE